MTESWKTLVIVTVHKKCDLIKPDNYRGISLSSHEAAQSSGHEQIGTST